MMTTGRILLVALAAVLAFGSVNGFERKIGSEERRLHAWAMGTAERQEQYLSIYCRCCGNEEGVRGIDAAVIPQCATYAGQTCRCPVREENGQSWWNFFGTDIQGRWNESCNHTILERANITLTAPPTTDAVDVEDGLTVTVPNPPTSLLKSGGN